MKYTEYLEKYLHHFDYTSATETKIAETEQKLGYSFTMALRNFYVSNWLLL